MRKREGDRACQRQRQRGRETEATKRDREREREIRGEGVASAVVAVVLAVFFWGASVLCHKYHDSGTAA